MIDQSTAILVTAVIAIIFGIFGSFIGLHLYIKELTKGLKVEQ